MSGHINKRWWREHDTTDGEYDTQADSVEACFTQAVDAFANDAYCKKDYYYDTCLKPFILANGRPFIPASFPVRYDVIPFVYKHCFVNALNLVIRFPNELRYVEGCGFSLAGSVLRDTLHAWAVDKNDRVIDPTWPAGLAYAYYGVEFDLNYVTAFRQRCEPWASVIGNHTEGWPLIFGKHPKSTWGLKIPLPAQALEERMAA